MQTNTCEIGDRIFRLSTCVPGAAPGGFTFNQFLVDADDPLLFHTGPRRMFPLVSQAIARIIPLKRLRWITFGHVESDECGAVNEFLAAAPSAEVAHGAVGCMVSLDDLCDRPPRKLADGEVIDLGGRQVRHIDTPHVPHNWEARVIFEQTTKTLFRVRQLKLRAASLGIAKIDAGATSGYIVFDEDNRIDPKRVLKLVQGRPKEYRLDGALKMRFAHDARTEEKLFARVERLLEELV